MISETVQQIVQHIQNGTLNKRIILRIDQWNLVEFQLILEQLRSSSSSCSSTTNKIRSLALRRQAIIIDDQHQQQEQQRTVPEIQQLFDVLATTPNLSSNLEILTLTWFHRLDDIRIVTDFFTFLSSSSSLSSSSCKLYEIRIRSNCIPELLTRAVSQLSILQILEICYLEKVQTNLLPLVQSSSTITTLEINIYGTGFHVIDPTVELLHALGRSGSGSTTTTTTTTTTTPIITSTIGACTTNNVTTNTIPCSPSHLPIVVLVPLVQSLKSLSIDGLRWRRGGGGVEGEGRRDDDVSSSSFPNPHNVLVQLIRNNSTLQSLEFHNSDLPDSATMDVLVQIMETENYTLTRFWMDGWSKATTTSSSSSNNENENDENDDTTTATTTTTTRSVRTLQYWVDLNAIGRGRIYGRTIQNKPPLTCNEDWIELLIKAQEKKNSISLLYYIVRRNPALCTSTKVSY